MNEPLKESGYSWYFSVNSENLDPMGRSLTLGLG
ncbi:hypothetical protein Oscil6304_4968 [Oscillatoria acuminata PCC 6304]|uniref:Uncharacterized protein n=1 Tax=Oscillatoria acuminata PCC 6304 TaxID=56110 RepID=K9TNP2_9CYAN|nr:hypothetical protein Oscil6304_4968 [Oscillatoria acuminata PCC 6304]